MALVNGGLTPPEGARRLGDVSGAVEFDAGVANVFTFTAVGNVTLTLANLRAGVLYAIDMTQDAVGSRTLAIGAGTTVIGPSLSPSAIANSRSVISFLAVDPSTIQQVAAGSLIAQATIVEAPDDQILILQGGRDTDGADTDDRENVRVQLGALDDGTNLSALFRLGHPALGDLFSLGYEGVAGAPDVINELNIGCSRSIDADILGDTTLDMTGDFLIQSNGPIGAPTTLLFMGDNVGIPHVEFFSGGAFVAVATTSVDIGSFSNANFSALGGAPDGNVRLRGRIISAQTIGGTICFQADTTTEVVSIGRAGNLAAVHRIDGLFEATVGAAGLAAPLPALPTGYLVLNIGGTNRKIPFYAT